MDLYENRNWYPMLLKEKEKPIDSEEYLYEVKWDGQRAIVFVSKEEVVIYNRHQRDISYLFPELQSLKNIGEQKVIFDGEIVSFEKGFPSFKKLQERTHLKAMNKITWQSINKPIIFIAFDILYENKNLVTLPLIKRKEILDKYQDTEVFIKNKFVRGNGKELWAKTKKMLLEGIVQKKIDSLYYINKRVDEWFKVKNFKEEVFDILGYIDKEESNVVSLVLGEKKDGKDFVVGKVVMAKKNKLYDKLQKCKRRKLALKESIKEAIFVEVKYQCKVKYIERTNNNHLRQPIFKEACKQRSNT